MQNLLQTVAEDVRLSQKWTHLHFQTFFKKSMNKFFSKWRRGIVHSACTYSHKISNSKSIAAAAEEVHLSQKFAKLTFAKIFKKSVIQISQNDEEESWTAPGPILIKYLNPNSLGIVGGEAYYS